MRGHTHRRRLRLAAALLALTPVAALFTACGGDSGSDGTVTLNFRWWGNQTRATLTEKAVDLFEQRNPGIKVNTSFSDFGSYWEKLATETAGGNPPDVIQMDYRYLNEYAGRGVLLDLSPYLGKQIDTSEWNPAFAATGKVNGKQISVPLAQNTVTIVCDVKAFEAAGVPLPKLGWTWRDYQELATKINASTGGKLAGATDFAGTEDVFEIWLRQRGKDLYNSDGKFGFDESDLRAFWQLADDFRKFNALTPKELTSTLNAGAEQTPLGKKLSASEHSYDSIFPGYVGARGQDPLYLAPYPSDDKSNLGQYRKPSQLVSVASRTKNSDAAVKLVNFLLNDVEAGKILSANRGLPPNLKIRDEVAKTLEGANKQIYEYEASIDKALGEAPPPPPKGDGAIYKLLQRINEEIVFGRVSVDDALKKFFSEAKQALG